MELRTMYPPQKDSPTTFLVGAITTTDTFAVVGNAGLLPQTLPYPLTIGIDRPITETVMVTAIDLVTNRLTFTRGSSALPWTAGTNVGRVFNAKDLKDVQDNIIDIHTNLSTAQSNIENLEDSVNDLEITVGNSSSGLVKGLADEITRATTAEQAEVTRATAAEANLDNIKINRTELPQVIIDAVYTADATKVTTTMSRYNASNQQTSQYARTIPIVSDENVGMMTPEAYNEITALRTDVSALQNQGGKFIGISFSTKAALDGYTIPSSVKIGDFTYVIDDEEHDDATTRYVFDGVKFDFAFVIEYDPIGIANTETAGIVKSSKLMVWTNRTAPVLYLSSICYGNGLFVAVSQSAANGNHVITSPDGIAWTIQANAPKQSWTSVCYGNGLFVAVSYTGGTGNRVMTSPDGITWTLQTTPVDNSWQSVCYGNGLFVAVAYSGTGNRVMTSPDGITWTIRTSAADNNWVSVCYGNGLFIAVATNGSKRVMTSPDGITWTSRDAATNNNWRSVCYGNGMFVAVAQTGNNDRVMTSFDGINWDIRTSAADISWYSVCYGNGMFVAVAYNGTGNQIMISKNGINWSIKNTTNDKTWVSICYGNGLFVAVANTDTTNTIMTSPAELTGKSYVEIDGTMSVIGWDDLNLLVESKADGPETQEAIIAIYNEVQTKVTTSVNATLGTIWSGSGPYTQDVYISGMTTSKNATIGLASSATQAQREMARNAMLSVTAQTTNQITITADGDKPTAIIPISVILMP